MGLDILICGAGIAGPALAFWLSRAGHNVTIIERHPHLRTAGAQIDLRAQGLQVAKRMGLIEIIRSHVVEEDGVALVDYYGKPRATIMANKSGKGAQTFTSEYEIMREDLVQILYNATKDTTKYVFGQSVDRFEQDDKSVTAYFSDGTSGTYDMLVGADGQGSRVRKHILPEGVDPLRHIGVYLVHWRVPTIATDTKIARMCHAEGGRALMTRTHSPVESQAGIMMRDDSEELRSISKASVEKQKAFWVSKCKGIAEYAPRLIDGLQTSDYFYCQEAAQVKTDTWYQGRVVLIADAAHCPSPMTGMGTTSALVGAYVLAGEITQTEGNVDQAFLNYDRTLRPFVDELQQLSEWGLSLFLPKTRLGIAFLRFVLAWLAFLRIPELAARFSSTERAGWQLPEYSVLNRISAEQT